MTPAGTSRPHRGRPGAGGRRKPAFPRDEPAQSPPASPHPAGSLARRGGSPGSAAHHALAGDGEHAPPGEGTAATGPPPDGGGVGGKKTAAAGSLPLAPPSRGITITTAVASCARFPCGGSRCRAPHLPAPASPLTSVPAHAQARPAARPPPHIGAVEGRGGAGAGPAAEVTACLPIAAAVSPVRPAFPPRASRDAGGAGRSR